MAINFSSLKTRIVLLFALLVVALQLTDGLLLNTVGTSNTRTALSEELQTGERVFRRLMEQNSVQLGQAARIPSSDFAFRKAVATGDRQTIALALATHAGQINAQALMLIGLDYKVNIVTTTPDSTGVTTPFVGLIKEAENNGQASALTSIYGQLYPLVVVPVLAPMPIAWVTMGFKTGDTAVIDMQYLTELDVSLLTHHKGGASKIDVSTLSADRRDFLAAWVANIAHGSPYSLTFSDGSDEYLTLVAPQTENSKDTAVVLPSSFESAMMPFYRLMRRVMLLSILVIALAIAGSLVIAHGIAGPIKQLAAFARRIATGDYFDPPDHVLKRRNDEIGDPSIAFEHMREGVASRETKIVDLAYHDPLMRLLNRTLYNDRLTLEITECAIIDDPEHALQNLEKLYTLGFHLSIDDLGTGYSSLHYLKRLPVDQLKIDKTFVVGIVKDQDDQAMVRSTIDIEHNMGLKVVVEGVENQATFDALRNLGCDVAQDYLISKAIEAADYAIWIKPSSWLRVA